MPNTANTQSEVNDILLSDDELLSELEQELNAEEAIESAVEVPSAAELNEEVVAADADVESEQAPPPAKAKQSVKKTAPAKTAGGKSKAKPKAKPKADPQAEAKTESKPAKRPSISGMPPSGALRTVLGDRLYEVCVVEADQMTMDEDARKLSVNEFLVNEVDTLAKKVKEKAINVFLAIDGKASLSVFTKIAIDMLAEKKELTSSELKNRYLGRPYSPGTAGAQSSQMMKLLPALKIATREGSRLYLDEDSPVFKALQE